MCVRVFVYKVHILLSFSIFAGQCFVSMVPILICNFSQLVLYFFLCIANIMLQIAVRLYCCHLMGFILGSENNFGNATYAIKLIEFGTVSNQAFCYWHVTAVSGIIYGKYCHLKEIQKTKTTQIL